ncbi:MAG: hypothetical protein GX312_00085 [Candidatus Phytoplasma sp.]|nr:hypothetical protein [Phytoplasma sp.]
MKKKEIIVVFIFILLIGLLFKNLDNKKTKLLIPQKKHDLLYISQEYLKQPLFFNQENHPVLLKLKEGEVSFKGLSHSRVEIEKAHIENKYYGYTLKIYLNHQKNDIIKMPLIMSIDDKSYELGIVSVTFKNDLTQASVTSLYGTKNEQRHLENIYVTLKISNILEVYIGTQKTTITKNDEGYILSLIPDEYLYDETYVLINDGENWFYIIQYQYFYHYQMTEGVLKIY